MPQQQPCLHQPPLRCLCREVNTHIRFYVAKRHKMSRCRRVASFFTTLLTVFQTSSHFLNSSHHCLITQQPFPHSSMANHCSIATCLILLSCHYGLLIAGQSTKKICHEKTVAAALNGSATKMRKRKKKEVHYCYLLHDFKRSSSSFVRVHSPLAT